MSRATSTIDSMEKSKLHHKSKNKKNAQNNKISLAPLSLEKALSGAMKIDKKNKTV
jgi:hypothetical protein